MTPPPATPAASPVAPAAGAPAATPQPTAAPAKKSGLKFFSMPMKVTLLVFLSVLLLGAFVVTQKSKTVNNSARAAVLPTKVPTTAPVITDVSPTVPGEIPLEVSSPANGTTVTSPNVVITGKTTPGADVMVNDATQKADAQGNFSLSVLLDEGDNILTITSVDPNGQYAEKEYKIVLNTNG
jgi:hypothetical protein